MRIFLFIASILFVCNPLSAGNGMDVKVRIGNDPDVDTIWAGSDASLDFYFENDLELVGLVSIFRLYSPDGVSWGWNEGVYRIYPPADTIWRYATVEEGSRMYPPDEVWDYYGLGLTQRNFDGISPDTFTLAGASAATPHMITGPMGHNITMRFQAFGPVADAVMTLCVDTTRSG